MVQYSVDAVLPMDARTYLLERDTAAFRSLVAKTLNLGELEYVDSWREGAVQCVKFVTKPDVTAWVPKSALKALPAKDMAFYDIVKYDPELLKRPPFVLHVQSLIPLLGDKTHIQSTLTIHEEGPNTTRQTLEGNIKIKVFGVGGMAERMVKGSLEKTYQRLPEVVERWAQFREEVLRQPGGREQLLLGRPSLSSVDWIREEVRMRLQAPYEAPGSSGHPAAAQQQPGFVQRTMSSIRRTTGRSPLPRRQGSATAAGAAEGAEQLDVSAARQPSGLWAFLQRTSRRTSLGTSSTQQSQQEEQTQQQAQHEQHGRGAASEPAGVAAALPRPPTPCMSANSIPPPPRVPSLLPSLLRSPSKDPVGPLGSAEDLASLKERSWSSFNRDRREWAKYWVGMGLPTVPGSVPLSWGLIRLGNFSYTVGLLHPSTSAAAPLSYTGQSLADGGTRDAAVPPPAATAMYPGGNGGGRLTVAGSEGQGQGLAGAGAKGLPAEDWGGQSAGSCFAGCQSLHRGPPWAQQSSGTGSAGDVDPSSRVGSLVAQRGSAAGSSIGGFSLLEGDCPPASTAGGPAAPAALEASPAAAEGAVPSPAAARVPPQGVTTARGGSGEGKVRGRGRRFKKWRRSWKKCLCLK